MEFNHVTIYVGDLEKSLEFYRDIIGLPVVIRFPAGPGTEIAFLGDGATKIELICDKQKGESDLGKDISLGFGVASVDETMADLKEKQVPIVSDILSPNPHTKFFYALDPDELKIQFGEHVE